MDNEQLVARIQGGDNEAENMLQLWQQNTGFITMLARKYSAGAEMEDLEQEGYIALCESVRHYDSDRGMSFISYAAFWIKRRMRICADNNRTVHLSFNVGDEVRQYQKIMREYRKEYGCDPSDRELCSFLGVNWEKLEHIRKAVQMGQIHSLNAIVPGTDGISYEEFIASDEDMEEDVIREIDKDQMERELWSAVDQLPGNLPAAVRLWYQEDLTLEKTGQRLGVNREKARQLESKAMRMLRQPHRCRTFQAYFEEYLSAAPIHHIGVSRFQTTWTSEVELEALRWAEKELEY